MNAKLTHVPLAVGDQEEAIRYYTQTLGWEERQDIQGPGGRFLTVAPAGLDVEFVLVEAKSKVDLHVGPEAGTGGYQWTFLTEDCRADYEALKARGVDFHVGNYTKPQKEFWGWNAAFKDPWGNLFVLVQPNWLGKIFGRLQARKIKARS